MPPPPHAGGGLEWTQSRKILEADLAVAQRLATSASAQTEAWWDPAAWESGELVLQRRLHQLNLDMLVMEGDGNCQFRSCSFGLYGECRPGVVRIWWWVQPGGGCLFGGCSRGWACCCSRQCFGCC